MKIALAVVMVAAAAILSAQRPVAPKPRSGEGGWTVPRTADGQPDLQGTWANNNATPLERPVEFAGRPTLTDAEVATLKARSARLFNGDGDAAFGDNLFSALLANPDKFVSTSTAGPATTTSSGFPIACSTTGHHSSPIRRTDGFRRCYQPRSAASPPKPRPGRCCRQARKDRSLSERCITFGVPRVQAAYMSYYDIVQSRDTVVFRMETIHDARVIPLDGRPHPGRKIRNVLGDSRGHWEGDTLVVDTTNFSPKSNFRGSHENLHLVERFTRVSAESFGTNSPCPTTRRGRGRGPR